MGDLAKPRRDFIQDCATRRTGCGLEVVKLSQKRKSRVRSADLSGSLEESNFGQSNNNCESVTKCCDNFQPRVIH
jgi:hypothetical protein